MSSAQWRSETISAVEHWLSLQPVAQVPRWTCLGTAQDSGEPGWLALDQRETLDVETLNEVCFAADGGPEKATAYPAGTPRQVDGVLLIKAPPVLPARSRMVWARTISPRGLIEKLLKGLRESGDSPIADALAQRRLGSEATQEVAEQPELTEAQFEAYRACLSDGVRLVWGPPGTGKTRVLAKAIAELIGSGKRVLLVSAANIAVDEAVRAVLEQARPARGAALRVGPPQLAALANNPDVDLRALSEQASMAVDTELRAIERRLAEWDALDVEVATLAEQVGDFQPAAYRAALLRENNRTEVDELAPRILAAEKEHENARGAAAVGRMAHHNARNRWDGIAEARASLEKSAELNAELERLNTERRATLAKAAAAETEVSEAVGWLATKKAERAHAKAAAAAAEFERAAAQQREKLSELIAEHQRIAGPITPEFVAELFAALERTQTALADIEQTEKQSAERLAELRTKSKEATERGLSSEADTKFLESARNNDLLIKFGQLESRIKAQRSANAQRDEVEKEHRRLFDRARALRRDVEKTLIEEASLVATTLVRARVHPALAKAEFDVVLVDEAGASSLAEVLLALCKARSAAVLFGDFLQPSPRRDLEDGELRRWVVPDVFSHVGIHTPEDARDNPDCISLPHQFRFGSGLRQLANDVIYQELRDARELPGIGARPDTEIVLVDTSDLTGLEEVRRPGTGAWWVAGMVLSRALAEHHLSPGGEVGIVTPYRLQRDATLAGLRDRRLVSGISVGTAAAFPGRGFDTVIFDLVEDGRSWAAGARRDRGEYEEDGVRLFGFGITRGRRRIYLLANRDAVQATRFGPLAAVADAARRGQVIRWSAAALLGMSEPDPRLVDSSFSEVRETLRHLVTVTDTSDEQIYYAELEKQLAAARTSVWIWTPWTSARAERIGPLLAEAVARGVQVRVFVRPEEERNMEREWAQHELPALRDSGATIIRSYHEQRKIVIVDEHTVLFGSMRTKRYPAGENMLTLQGGEFAKLLFAELRGEDLGIPHSCAQCGEECEVRRAAGNKTEWLWYCVSCGNREQVPASQ